LLRGWRDLRGKSQLDLSLDAGISQRHLSFIETGRSVPSRETLLQVAEALDVPLRERNALLLAAGYAPAYPEPAWDAPEMASIAAALRRMLRQHEPFPAIVMDRYWDVVLTNDAAPRFFGRFVNLSARPTPRNMLHLMFDPDGMRPFVANWEGVARSLLARVRREAVGRVLDTRSKALVAALLCLPRSGLPSGRRRAHPHAGHSAALREGRGRAELLFHGHHGGRSANGCGPGAARRVHVPGRRRNRALARNPDPPL